VGAAEIFVDLVRTRDREEHWRRGNSSDDPGPTLFIMFVPRSTEDEYAMYYADIPRIDIYRYGCTPDDAQRAAVELAASSPCPLHELISFAHELGHHESASRGTFCQFDEAQPVETYEEEVRAWTFGRAILVQMSFADWGAFAERERASLLGYRVGLKVSEEAAHTIELRIRADSAPVPVEGAVRPSVAGD
jgi:hypothetical protein